MGWYHGAMKHALSAILIMLGSVSTAGTDPAAPVATITTATPLIRAKLPGAKDFRNVTKGDTLPEGATVVTMAQGKAEIRFTDGHYVILSPNSSIEIKRLPVKGKEQTLLRLVRGAVRALVDRSKREGDFGIYANTTITAVKGTDYEVTRDEADNVDVEVNEGRINSGEMKSEDQAEAEAAFKAVLAGMIGQMIMEGQRIHTPRAGHMSKPEAFTRPPREPRNRDGVPARTPKGSHERGGHGKNTDTQTPSSGETPSGTDHPAHGKGGHHKGSGGKGGGNKGPGMPSMPGMGGLGF